jgi:hypothetical protein
MLSKAFYMHFINDGLGHVPTEMTISAPVEMVIDDHAFGRANDSIVTMLKGACERFGVRVN